MFVQAPEGRSVMYVTRLDILEKIALYLYRLIIKISQDQSSQKFFEEDTSQQIQKRRETPVWINPLLEPERDETDNMLVSDNIEYNTVWINPLLGQEGFTRQWSLNASFITGKLASRRIFRKPGNGSPPEKRQRIPISVWIFGVRLNGILDTGSERSYINEKVYEDIKHLAAVEVGALFHNSNRGSVAGEQYLSVLPDLGWSSVLGMDFSRLDLRFKSTARTARGNFRILQKSLYFNLSTVMRSQHNYVLCLNFKRQIKRISGG
ncbi:hypothetical protein KQX54_000713 [Cotesia glomerata]|uniref:Peptidase A2 domain-containing protein n=1 Tax=Cotesia glomerata TaxID=32391 RepID=A0AAV7IR61_COTGL|nr:hypothetical protein KQX54_000713 [Cotesia glomerata]